MEKHSWTEMQRYWVSHSARLKGLDYQADPDGLGNVLHAGAPLWLNQYYARVQEDVYDALFSAIPVSARRGRALDVGCGAGRWSRLLAERGYETVGIDLQPDTVELNRARYPHVKFVNTAIQDFETEWRFDLVSSVTVLQHIPFSEQGRAIDRMRELTRTGGYALVLENLRDKGPHVFTHGVERWRGRFSAAGYECIRERRYDYNPFLRLHRGVLRGVARGRAFVGRRSPAVKASLDQQEAGAIAPAAGAARQLLRGLNRTAHRCAMEIDSVIEPVFVRHNLRLPTLHCGFLFRAI